MEELFFLPFIRAGKSFFIFLTLGCLLYMAYYLTAQRRHPALMESKPVPAQEVLPAPVDLEAKPEGALDPVLETRNIFSSSTVSPAALEQAPTGLLPPNLKVVGIIIDGSAQVVIEDTAVKQSYFISEKEPAGGISIARVEKDHIIVNYQGQDFSLPVNNPVNHE